VKIDWDSLENHEFEELCYYILRKKGFSDLVWNGRAGNDRGRDITCKRVESILGKEITRDYVVQCKRYVARPPSPSDLNNDLAWAEAHKPDVLLIMVSNTLGSNTSDWLSSVKKSKPYLIDVFEEIDFKNFLAKIKKYMKCFLKIKIMI